MAEKVVSLYLEDNDILLLISKNGKVLRWAKGTLEPGLIIEGVIQDEEKVAAKVKELFTTIHQIKSSAKGLAKIKESASNLFSGKGKLIVGIGGRGSLYRVLSLPMLADNLLGEAVRREAGRVLPVALDELYLSYQRIPGANNETRIFMAAYPKKSTDLLLKTLRLAGLQPRSLDLTPLVLCSSVNEPRSIIADVSQDTLNIIVMAERVPQVIRSLPMQSEIKSLHENMLSISEEFSRTVAFYNSSHQQNPLDESVPVFVSGEFVNAPDTWKILVGKLNSKVAVLPTVMQYPENFPVNEYIVNLGLAAKELSLDKQPSNYSVVNLNCLPASFLPKPINVYNVLVPVVAVGIIVGIFLLWTAWQNDITKTKALDPQLTSIQHSITVSTQSITTLTEQNRALQAQIQPIQDYVGILMNKLSSLQATRGLTDSNISKVISLKSDKVIITSLNYDSTNRISLNGSAATRELILDYAQVLRDSGLFTTVVSSVNYYSIISESGEQVISYKYVFQIQ